MLSLLSRLKNGGERAVALGLDRQCRNAADEAVVGRAAVVEHAHLDVVAQPRPAVRAECGFTDDRPELL